MKLRVILTVFSIVASLLPSLVSAERVIPSERVTSSVAVKDEPRSGSDVAIVGRLRPGELAVLLDKVPYYYHVRLGNGTEGYVAKSWTEVIPDTVPAPTASLEIHFVDVGQGDSTLVVCPNGEHILVDAGTLSGRSSDIVRDYVLEQLNRHEGRVHTLVITHPDLDHYNLLPEVLRGVQIDRVIRVGQQFDYSTGFWNWLSGFSTDRTTVLGPADYDRQDRPNQVMDCGAADVWILAAAVDSSTSRKNAMSIVLMVRYGEFEAILTGDATHATEEEIASRYPANWLDVDLLKIGHHGSLTTSTSQEWADLTRPQFAVASAGYRSRHGHPRQEVIERLDDHTISWEPHPFQSATRIPGRYVWHDEYEYREAIFSTAASGHVVFTTNGHTTAVDLIPLPE